MYDEPITSEETYLKEIFKVDVKEDPVRPELSSDFRTQLGRKVYALNDLYTVRRLAVINLAWTTDVPKTNEELAEMTDCLGDIIIAYTVWAY